MKKLLSIALLSAAALAAPLVAHADPLVGTFTVNYSATPSTTPPDLTTPVTSWALTSGGAIAGNGSFQSFVTNQNNTAGNPGYFSTSASDTTFYTNGSTPFTFTLYNAPIGGGANQVVGTFTETGTPYQITDTASTDTWYIVGNFVGAGPLAGDSNTMSIIFSINVNGGAYSASGPSAAPAVGLTPEPSSFLLLGTGLIGMAFLMRRRFAL